MRRLDDHGVRDVLLVALTFSTGAIDAISSSSWARSSRRS
jgi:hypothetical protein